METGKTYRYTLDRKPKKFLCPGCNKRRFVRFVDTETGEYLPEHYGRCDREQHCSYFLSPYHEGQMIDYSTEIKTQPKPKPVFIPFEVMAASRKNYTQNSLVNYLLTIFDEDTVINKIIKPYHIGTSKYLGGSAVFWFIDKYGQIRAGQVKAFDQTGHTLKGENIKPTTWVHELLKSEPWTKDYRNQERKVSCLFGEHLLKHNTKPIAVCEAPKTALIASVYYDQYLWLATGSKAYLTNDRLLVLKDKDVTLFPDLGAYEEWKAKSDYWKFKTSDILERVATPQERTQGLDIADYLTRFGITDFKKNEPEYHIEKLKDGRTILMHPAGYPASWSDNTIEA